MKCPKLLDHVTKTLAGIQLGGKKSDPKLAALDRGVLQIALMVAALDGEILPSEYAAFESLVRKCRGYTAKNARELLDASVGKAGCLMAMAQIGAYSEKERLASFVEMAIDALPKGFAAGSLADLRRAFVLWTSMGLSDGAFSPIERAAVKALAESFARLRAGKSKKPVSLLEPAFFKRAESLILDLANASKRAKAEAALDELVATVAVPTADGVVVKASSSVAVRAGLIALVAAAGLSFSALADETDDPLPISTIFQLGF